MLEVSRGEIEAYLKEHGVPHVEDETNDDVNYTRNKVRHQLLPLLEELNPQAEVGFRPEVKFPGADIRLRRAGRGRTPDAPLPPCLLPLLEELNPQAAAHIAAAARRLREDEEELSRQASAGKPARRADPPRRRDRPPGPGPAPAPDGPPAPPAPPAPAARRTHAGPGGAGPLAAPERAGPRRPGYPTPPPRPEAYLVRPRREGDRLTLGRRPEKTVKKLMIEGKVPARRRARVPVLALGGRAAAVGGLGPEKDCLAAPHP